MDFSKLPPASDIPIVGQPFTIRDWYPTLLLVCHCKAQAPVIVSRSAGQCPGCHKRYSIQGLQVSPQGQMTWQIGIGVPTPSGAESAYVEPLLKTGES